MKRPPAQKVPKLSVTDPAQIAVDYCAENMAVAALKGQFLTGDFTIDFKQLGAAKQRYVIELVQIYNQGALLLNAMGQEGVMGALLKTTRKAHLYFDKVARASNQLYKDSKEIENVMQLLRAYAGEEAQAPAPAAPPPPEDKEAAAEETVTLDQAQQDVNDDMKAQIKPPGWVDSQEVAACTSYAPCTNYECRTCWPEGRPS